MWKQSIIVLALLSVGVLNANSKEAEAANEDVPKGPTAAPPQKPASSQSSSGSANGGDKKGAPSGDVTGGTAKPAGKGK